MNLATRLFEYVAWFYNGWWIGRYFLYRKLERFLRG